MLCSINFFFQSVKRRRGLLPTNEQANLAPCVMLTCSVALELFQLSVCRLCRYLKSVEIRSYVVYISGRFRSSDDELTDGSLSACCDKIVLLNNWCVVIKYQNNWYDQVMILRLKDAWCRIVVLCRLFYLLFF